MGGPFAGGPELLSGWHKDRAMMESMVGFSGDVAIVEWFVKMRASGF